MPWKFRIDFFARFYVSSRAECKRNSKKIFLHSLSVWPRINDVDVAKMWSHWGAWFLWVPLPFALECFIYASSLASHFGVPYSREFHRLSRLGELDFCESPCLSCWGALLLRVPCLSRWVLYFRESSCLSSWVLYFCESPCLSRWGALFSWLHLPLTFRGALFLWVTLPLAWRCFIFESPLASHFGVLYFCESPCLSRLNDWLYGNVSFVRYSSKHTLANWLNARFTVKIKERKI